ncbi:MAG: OmpA family protein [Pseudomonadales bacterium]
MKRSSLFLAILIVFSSPIPAEDMPGGSDHALIPRVAGSTLKGHAHSGYDAGSFVNANDGSKLSVEQPEGERSRMLYLAKAGDSPLMVQKNYEAALAELGEVEEVFSCRAQACPGSSFATLLWNREVMLETHELKHPYYLLGVSHAVKTPAYRYARVVKDGTQYHVGVFAAGIADNNANVDERGLTAVLVEVLEVKDFEATLEFVDATAMRSEIDSAGHVALYGIHFDHDKDTLRTESNATIAEIVKVLKADAALSIYVVGHTDTVGALEYNQALSLRRAQSVVNALVSGGISAERLTPIGIGPVAPIASNDNEEGRGLNRRVELVKRP